MGIRIGRWHLNTTLRAVYITREPDPTCPNCAGSSGSWMPHGIDADWDECPCLDQLRTWTIPLLPRNRNYEEAPF
jgi:hypothetical protein